MTWYAFKGYPPINIAGAQEKLATSIGFHGYATQAQASANPNSVSPLQKLYINVLEADYQQAKSVGQEPGGPNANLANPGSDVNAAGEEAGNVTGINAIGAFFNKAQQRNAWLRVAEFGIGGMLLYVGAKALFPGTIQTVTAPAKKAAKKTLKYGAFG